MSKSWDSVFFFWRVRVLISLCHAFTKDIHNKCKGVASLKSPDATSLPNMVQLASRLMLSSVDLMVYGPSIQELLQIALQGLSANDEDVDSLVPLMRANTFRPFPGCWAFDSGLDDSCGTYTLDHFRLAVANLPKLIRSLETQRTL